MKRIAPSILSADFSKLGDEIKAVEAAGADWIHGASHISVQVETCIHLNRTVHLIKDCGAHAGVVLNPSTPVKSLEWTLEYVDYVLIMGVKTLASEARCSFPTVLIKSKRCANGFRIGAWRF
jgi:ribulose-phosphate 3-epimerase